MVKTRPSQPLIIWYVTDEKPGHLNQILGLVEAIKRHFISEREIHHNLTWNDTKAYVFSTRKQRRALFKNNWSLFKALLGFCPRHSLPEPQLVIGAGHATHWTVVAASRAFKAPSVILMKPSLPEGFFDYLIVPEHDGLNRSEKVFMTRGAINRIQPQTKVAGTGLILLGGPSKHFWWHDHQITQQLQDLLVFRPDIHWQLSTSPRTPDNIEKQLSQITLQYNNIKLIKFADCEKNWLHNKITTSEQVWVTPDSVSMVYEALTSGADVGIFNMKSKDSKVSKSITALINNQSITPLNLYLKEQKIYHNQLPFAEADKAASWLIKKISNNNLNEK